MIIYNDYYEQKCLKCTQYALECACSDPFNDRIIRIFNICG